MAVISCGICYETQPFQSLHRPGCSRECNENFKTHARCLRFWFEVASRTNRLMRDKCPHCRTDDPLRERTWRYIREGAVFLGKLATPFLIVAFCGALLPQTKKISNPFLQKFCEEALQNVAFALSFPHIASIFIPMMVPDYHDWMPRL